MTKDDVAGANDLEINVAGKGSGVVVKGEGSLGFKQSEATRAVKELSETIDPSLATKCESIANQVGAGNRPPVDPPIQSGPHYTGSMGPLEYGLSYNQGDLYDRPSGSPEECSRLCYNDDRCLAVTFIPSQQRCWVKGSIGPVGRSGEMVSARKLAK